MGRLCLPTSTLGDRVLSASGAATGHVYGGIQNAKSAAALLHANCGRPRVSSYIYKPPRVPAVRRKAPEHDAARKRSVRNPGPASPVAGAPGSGRVRWRGRSPRTAPSRPCPPAPAIRSRHPRPCAAPAKPSPSTFHPPILRARAALRRELAGNDSA